jgi:hypothetical protein
MRCSRKTMKNGTRNRNGNTITSFRRFQSCAAKSGHCVVLTTLPLILAASETLLRCGMFAIVPIVPIVTGEMRYDSAPQRGLSWQEGGGYEVFE